MLLGELMAELELLSAHRVDSMWSEGEGDTIAKLLEALVVLVASFAIQLRTLSISLIEECVGEVCTQSHLFDSLRRLERVHIHIEETGRPRAKHLQTSETSAYVDIIGRHLSFDGPDIILEPSHQW